MTSEPYDVAVVGGGLVGASLIHALSATALRVVWIDRRDLSESARDPRSTALALASQRLLDELGLWQEIAEHACGIRSVHVSQQHHFGSVLLTAEDMDVPALGYVAPNRAMAASLVDRIAGADRVTVMSPDSVCGFTQSEDGARLELDSGETVYSRLVVAADGAQSTLREAAGIGLKREIRFDQHAVVTEVSGRGWPAGRAWERFCNFGPLALLPLNADTLSVVYTVPDAQLDAVLSASDDAFLADIRARAGFVGQVESASPRAHFPLVAVEAEAAWRGRLVLLGNAVRTLHPVAGQGFNLALRDALTLAELLGELASGQDPASDPIAERYRGLRRLDQVATRAGTEAFARLFRGDSKLFGHLRGAGLVLTDRAAPLRRRLARQFMGLAGRLPRVPSRV
ncbi:MAG: FAD-dependent monooxygenase [Pseudomonadota bacterium]